MYLLLRTYALVNNTMQPEMHAEGLPRKHYYSGILCCYSDIDYDIARQHGYISSNAMVLDHIWHRTFHI